MKMPKTDPKKFSLPGALDVVAEQGVRYFRLFSLPWLTMWSECADILLGTKCCTEGAL